MDIDKIKRYMRWTKRRFKENTPLIVWHKIQENPGMMREYMTFESEPPRYSQASVNVEFAIKAYGWEAFLEAIWIIASRKEETMHQLQFKDDEERWCKVKDKIAQMPKHVQL